MAVKNEKTGIDYVTIVTEEKIPMSLRATRLLLRAGSAIAPGLTSGILLRIFLTPKRVRMDKRRMQVFEKGETSFSEYDGVRVFRYVRGEGPQVLVVHGWGSSSYQMRYVIRELVDSGFRVIAFDAPASGLSGGKRTHGLQIAKIILDLEREFGGFHGVVTHSFGGFAAMVALRDGLRVNKVASVAMPVTPEPFFNTFFELLQVTPRMQERVARRFEELLGQTREELTPMRMDVDLPDMLLVHDEDDKVLPLSEAKEFARSREEVELVVTSGLGHRRIVADKDVLGMISEFMNDGIWA